MIVSYTELERACEKLDKHKWYFELDKDYADKLRIVYDVRDNWNITELYSREYAIDIARFMLDANKRIFKED